MENNGRTMVILLIGALLLAVGTFLYFEFVREDVEMNPVTQNPPAENANNANEDLAWLYATTTEYAIQYPADLELDYIDMVDWPPEVELSAGEFTCEEDDETESVTVQGNEYCRTMTTEGAAGSIYTEYSYAFADGEGTATLSFSTRTPQCANYEADKMEDCEAEVEDFDVDVLVNSMARTLMVEGA